MPAPVVAPSLLAADHGDFAGGIRAVEEAGLGWVHLDIMDGHFVPNISFGPQVVAALRPRTRLHFDVHLMLAHPDRFVARPPEERAKASSEAAGLNDAYRILKDPLSRAFYLAELNGVDLPGDGKTIDDPDLLMEAMEAREALHEASSPEAVDALAAHAREDMQQALKGLGTLFLRHDNAAMAAFLRRCLEVAPAAAHAAARAIARAAA